jgi:hypothetical protein
MLAFGTAEPGARSAPCEAAGGAGGGCGRGRPSHQGVRGAVADLGFSGGGMIWGTRGRVREGVSSKCIHEVDNIFRMTTFVKYTGTAAAH